MVVPRESPIHTQYFNLNDDSGVPLAGLLVVFDRNGRPVRSELHVAADFESADVDESMRQARRLLGEHYTLSDGGALPLYVLRLDLANVVNVRLPSNAPPALRRPEQRHTFGTSGTVANPVSHGRKPAPRRGGRQRRGAVSRYATVAMVSLALILAVWTVSAFQNNEGYDAFASSGPIISESTGALVTDVSLTRADNEADASLSDEATASVDEAQFFTAVPTATPTPIVQDSYCMWPGDTLSRIALNAGVSEDAILALNPNFTGQAGSTIQLPVGSVAPAFWTEPAPQIGSIKDLPFGVSGYYISYDNRQKRVALSFDVGYVEGNKELMELLAARGIRATFFVLGSAVENHPEMIASILHNGHELGNHSFTHDNTLGMTADEVAQELMVTEDLVQAAYPGATTKPLFHVPFGALNDNVIETANRQGYHVIGWTVDSRDWTDEITPDDFYDRVTQHVCPGAIIAMHDANQANRTALPQVLDFLENNEYEFVTVSEILVAPHYNLALKTDRNNPN